MSSEVSSYIATLLIYLGVNGIACWALNLQFGVGGVMNFAFIIYQAIGAYVTAVLTLPSDKTVPDETYILGWHLAWPLPLVGAAVAGGMLALVVGSFSLRPRRRDFQATVMLVVSIIAATLVSAEQGWFNGNQGLFGIPQPFASSLNLSIVDYDWFFAGVTAAVAVLVWFLTARFVGSPWGRRLRAMRENAEAVEALGTNTRAESLKVYVIGGAIGALSGGLLVEFIAGFSTAAWGTGETFIYFVAIIVGGLGNSFGAVFGAFLVLGVFLELPTFLPQLADANIEESLQSAFIGVLILVFLWWRPQGIFPERRRRLSGLLSSPGGATSRIPRLRARWQKPSSYRAREGTLDTLLDLSVAVAKDKAVEQGVAAVLAAEQAPAPVSGRGAAQLSVRDLRVSFGGVQAVDGLSFDLVPGKATGLIGPNGAGKSTALKLIAGAARPQCGQVLVDGSNVAGWPAPKVARLGLIRTFQHTSEFGRLTVLENLLTAARALQQLAVDHDPRADTVREEHVDEVLDAVRDAAQLLGKRGGGRVVEDAHGKAGCLSKRLRQREAVPERRLPLVLLCPLDAERAGHGNAEPDGAALGIGMDGIELAADARDQVEGDGEALVGSLIGQLGAHLDQRSAEKIHRHGAEIALVDVEPDGEGPGRDQPVRHRRLTTLELHRRLGLDQPGGLELVDDVGGGLPRQQRRAGEVGPRQRAIGAERIEDDAPVVGAGTAQIAAGARNDLSGRTHENPRRRGSLDNLPRPLSSWAS